MHAREIINVRNFSPGNAGPVFFFDALVPVVHLSLLRAYGKPEARRKR